MASFKIESDITDSYCVIKHVEEDFVSSADRITANIWIGEWNSTKEEEFLVNTPISQVLTLCSTRPQFEEKIFLSDILERQMKLKDQINFCILPFIDQCINFIEEAVKNDTQILINSRHGVSRSGAIVCAYLMKQNNWSYEKALNFVQKKRGNIKPNLGFALQLRTWYRMKFTYDKNKFYQNKIDTLNEDFQNLIETLEKIDKIKVDDFNVYLFRIYQMNSLEEAAPFLGNFKKPLESLRRRSGIHIEDIEGNKIQNWYQKLGFMKELTNLGFLCPFGNFF